MAVPWYEWRHIRERLLSYGRAIQGVSPYRIAMETDKRKCPTGYINFTKRLIMVNPTMIVAPDEEQYRFTKAVLCHEAGHRRFTTPSRLPPHIHLVSNILEDERIERLMEGEFAGVRSLLKDLSGKLLEEAPPLDPESEDPVQILSYLLQLRWAERCGDPIKGSLSLGNRARWEEIESLVLEAWNAENSATCDRTAEEIVRILGLEEPDIPEWLKRLLGLLEIIEGERGSTDAGEAAMPGTSPAASEEHEDKPFDGEIKPYDHGVGDGWHTVEPKPYLALMEQVRPLVARLVEELSLAHEADAPAPAERGGRLSVRQYLHDPNRPFLVPEGERPAPPTLSVRVIIDHSASMNVGNRIEKAAQAAMLVHLTAIDLAIPHQVVVTPNDIRVAHLESGERGLALIAGIIPAQTGREDTGLAVSRHGGELAARSEDIKLLLVIHDGMGNDYDLLTKECHRLRNKVIILGVGLGMGEMEAALLKAQFGPDRYVHCPLPEDLPGKIGAILRSIRGV
ncbi:MAG: hypothetical protein Q8R28_03155 [Dehalococcoidia bacterium]|nr:hypothetical protein [Dehalococcoidia bacterium]